MSCDCVMLTLSLINLVLVLVRNDCFVHYYVVEDSGDTGPLFPMEADIVNAEGPSL